MRVIALPVKSLSASKSRLDPLLSPLERGALTLAMLEDVMDATLALTGWETWVISPDEAVLEVAVRRGVHVIVEEKPPLANAVRQVEAEAIAHMAEVLAILLADTPFVTTRALTRALRTLGPVVLAPSADESGTNLLVRRPPTAIHARFGSDSFRKHLQIAAEADLPAAVVETPELAFDLDLPGDILTVLEGHTRGRTLDVCLDMDLRSRLTARTR
ncbi:MAG: 2-phospho-L-lactate guanylyltransferase [Actinomycetota bacterium]|nr:2-phospho-L-lactate guanylyltransferase [Actinomycetota bacterium]